MRKLGDDGKTTSLAPGTGGVRLSFEAASADYSNMSAKDVPQWWRQYQQQEEDRNRRQTEQIQAAIKTEYDAFEAACLEVLDVAPSKLNGLWFHSAIKTYWRQKPSELASERMAYVALLKGCSAQETVAIVGAHHLHHDVDVETPDHLDAMIEMVENKIRYGKGAKKIKAAKQNRRKKHTAVVAAARDRKRVAAGTKKRITAKQVWDVLPESNNDRGEDMEIFSYNHGRPTSVEEIMTAVGASRDSVEKHLHRMRDGNRVRKSDSGVWYRLRSDIWALFPPMSSKTVKV
jgi:biotin operon repressor